MKYKENKTKILDTKKYFILIKFLGQNQEISFEKLYLYLDYYS
jgi:hypothetical protein